MIARTSCRAQAERHAACVRPGTDMGCHRSSVNLSENSRVQTAQRHPRYSHDHEGRRIRSSGRSIGGKRRSARTCAPRGGDQRRCRRRCNGNRPASGHPGMAGCTTPGGRVGSLRARAGSLATWCRAHRGGHGGIGGRLLAARHEPACDGPRACASHYARLDEERSTPSAWLISDHRPGRYAFRFDSRATRSAVGEAPNCIDHSADFGIPVLDGDSRCPCGQLDTCWPNVGHAAASRQRKPTTAMPPCTSTSHFGKGTALQ